jgi:hypothetical protein
MYEELNCFEEALKHFGTRVEVICAMELSNTPSGTEIGLFPILDIS